MTAHAEKATEHHPMGVYYRVWALLFVLSALSYLTDYFEINPLWLRVALILGFSIIKATLILQYFMHLKWERLSLIYTILLPPLLILMLVAIIFAEGEYIVRMRDLLQGGL